MALLGGNSCQCGLESPVSLGLQQGAASAALLPRVPEQSVYLWALKTVSLLLRNTVNVELLMSKKLLQLCSGLRGEIVWCKVSPRLGTT